MIPKVIHYCWFGRNEKPELAKKCIKSWKKKCPKYKIIEWNEDNYDLLSAPLYVQQAYKAKKWAFVTDYVRLDIVYRYGGVYLDTDVQLIKNIDHLLNNQAFFGFENETEINTGLGFGAEPKNSVVRLMLDDYKEMLFIREDGSYNLMTCTEKNTNAIKHLMSDIKDKTVVNYISGATIYPIEYFRGFDYTDCKVKKTKNTVSIHWYSGSWESQTRREQISEYREKCRKKNQKDRIDSVIHIPNRLLIKILGNERYDKLKSMCFSARK